MIIGDLIEMKLTKTKSKLFTNTEYDELQLRLKGKKKHYSIYSNRLKPKLIEFVALADKYLEKIKEMIKQPSVPRRNKRKGTGG